MLFFMHSKTSHPAPPVMFLEFCYALSDGSCEPGHLRVAPQLYDLFAVASSTFAFLFAVCKLVGTSGKPDSAVSLHLICIFTVHTSVLCSLRRGLRLKRGVIKSAYFIRTVKGGRRDVMGRSSCMRMLFDPVIVNPATQFPKRSLVHIK